MKPKIPFVELFLHRNYFVNKHEYNTSTKYNNHDTPSYIRTIRHKTHNGAGECSFILALERRDEIEMHPQFRRILKWTREKRRVQPLVVFNTNTIWHPNNGIVRDKAERYLEDVLEFFPNETPNFIFFNPEKGIHICNYKVCISKNGKREIELSYKKEFMKQYHLDLVAQNGLLVPELSEPSLDETMTQAHQYSPRTKAHQITEQKEIRF